MDSETLQKLKTATDRPTLKRAGMQFAASTDQADLDTLREQLSTPAFFSRLDADEDYDATFSSLRVGQIVKTLIDNTSKPSEDLRLKLTTDPVFNAHIFRQQLLVRALVPIRPAPPGAVAYWDKLSSAKSPIAYDVFEALIANQSPPAIALLERKLLDPAHQAITKSTVMRNLILPRRNDEPLLDMSERLLKSNLSPDLKNDLLEALFDYKPDDWYRGCEVPKPPSRAVASTAAKETLRRIVQVALASIRMQAPLEGKIRLVEQELGKPRQP